jgi:hypothetical protein
MTSLGRLLFGALGGATTMRLERILPTDQLVACLDCQSDRPMFMMFNLHSLALRDGKIVEEVTGRRVACQDCGSVFSIGPHGKFRQHREALPISPQGPMRTTPKIGRAEDIPDDEPPRTPVLPMPLKRPNV